MPTMKERMAANKTLTAIAATATSIVAISGALAVFGIELPRPVWADELKIVEMKVLELDNTITSQQLDETSLRLYQNLREQNNYKQRGELVPNYLLQEQSTLEGKKRRLEIHLQKLIDKQF